MIADLKPYAEYKESGLPWLGQVPGHWELRQARHIGRLLKGVGGTKEDAVPVGVPCVRYGELYTTHTYFICANKAFVRADRAGAYTPIQYGDVLFAASGETIEEIGKSAVNLMHTAAVCGGDVIVLRPSILVHAPFLGYAMDSRPATNQKATMGRGTTVKHIYPDELRGLLVPLPTLDEQAAIVRFLDWANGRLERAIRAKRKVIALLTEQKQAIIHLAVTRGLDPSVPLKPSGIPWLGDIPQHWDFRAFARMARIVRGASPRPAGDTRFFNGKYIPWLTVGEVTKDPEIYLTKTEASLTKLGEQHSVRFSTGTLVITNSGATLGVPKILSIDVCANDGIVAFLRLSPVVDPIFAYYYISTLTERLRDELRQGGTQPNINTGIVRSITCPLPPKSEQLAIVEFLESELVEIRAVSSRLEREIELLREYRTRLVADVVTGKLDVREATARLPEGAAAATVEDAPDLSEETELADEEAAV